MQLTTRVGDSLFLFYNCWQWRPLPRGVGTGGLQWGTPGQQGPRGWGGWVEWQTIPSGCCLLILGQITPPPGQAPERRGPVVENWATVGPEGPGAAGISKTPKTPCSGSIGDERRDWARSGHLGKAGTQRGPRLPESSQLAGKFLGPHRPGPTASSHRGVN